MRELCSWRCPGPKRAPLYHSPWSPATVGRAGSELFRDRATVLARIRGRQLAPALDGDHLNRAPGEAHRADVLAAPAQILEQLRRRLFLDEQRVRARRDVEALALDHLGRRLGEREAVHQELLDVGRDVRPARA